MKSINEIINESEVKKTSSVFEILDAIEDALKISGFKEEAIDEHNKDPKEMSYTFIGSGRETRIEISIGGEFSDDILINVVRLDFDFVNTQDGGMYCIYCADRFGKKDFVWNGMSAKDVKNDLYEAIKKAQL